MNTSRERERYACVYTYIDSAWNHIPPIFLSRYVLSSVGDVLIPSTRWVKPPGDRSQESPQQRLAGELALSGRWFEGKKTLGFRTDV